VKKELVVLLLITMVILGGCLERDSYEDRIPMLVKEKVEAIVEKNIERYLETVDDTNKEYYHEQKRWINDIATNKIENYELNIVEMKPIDESNVVVTLNQKYSYKYKDYDLIYDAIYRRTEKGWKDSGVNFKMKETDNFIVKYMDGEENLDKIINAAEKAHGEVVKRYGKKPLSKTVLKLYRDRELLRQMTKLSIEWQFTGWFEINEGLKVFTGREQEYSYQALLEHELTHRITMEAANNNLPYWFAEGLATNYANFYQRGGDPIELGWYNKKDFNLTIAELEKINLEKLTQGYDIGRYYGVSGMIVKYLNHAYGKEKVIELVEELGEYPFNDNIANDNFDMENQEKLDEVFERVLNKETEEISEEWLTWLDTRS